MTEEITPRKRSRRPEILIFLGMLVFYAVFLAVGSGDRLEVFLERAGEAETFAPVVRHAALAGGGLLAILGIILARKMRGTVPRRQLLLAAAACALLAAWQAFEGGASGLLTASGALIAALSFLFAARSPDSEAIPEEADAKPKPDRD